MKRLAIPLACISLAACSPQQTDNAVLCGAGLMAAKATIAAEIIQAAQQVPACRALALDAMQLVITEVMARRGIR